MISEGKLKVYTVLYTNKEGLHIREISKKAHLTLPSVFKHIKEGEEKNIVSCETKGRMRICRLNFGNDFLAHILQEVESERFNKLPPNIKRAFKDFSNDLQERPLIAAVFGSYASGNYLKNSDLDVLLVYQRIDSTLMGKIEASASKVKGRTSINIQPVSISHEEFKKSIMDLENEFMKDIKKSAIIIYGMEAYISILSRFYL